mgnify:CR=1 FL=1|jgi:hypothetical protein
MSRKKRIFQNQRLFTPRVVRRFTTSTGVLKEQNQNSMSGSAPDSLTGSFRLDPPGSPLRSTQQLPVDYSNFENHTFFSSAMTNVNLAFEKIINQFPFDGTRKEYDNWLDNLTGFENYILNRYPSYTGYLTFDDDQYIHVNDRAGVTFPSISKRSDGATILSPNNNSFFIELDISVPNEKSEPQYIFHHISSEGVGYAAYLEASSAVADNVDVKFDVLSGSLVLQNSASLEKGKFSHICLSYDNSPSSNKSFIMSGSKTLGVSSRSSFGSINTGGSPFLIGTGSSTTTFTPTQTLSGSINNFRVFHKTRSAQEIDRYSVRTLYAEEDPKLSLRFNEATGSYANSDVVLDHSGQSLHSRISNYSAKVRVAKPVDSLYKYEEKDYHPTLFPGHADIVALNEDLLTSGSTYDENNPNIITSLIPEHYLDIARASMTSTGDSREGGTYEGIKSTADKYALPGSTKIGQPQIISALLFTWARSFDELKMMIDHVSEMVHIDYDSSVSVADQMLPFLAEYYGFDLPNLFKNANYDQFFSGEGVAGAGGETDSLKLLQNEMWRRILTNMNEVITSKGTVHAIKSLFRSAGIDPNRMFRFVEYGGSRELRLGKSRRNITEVSTLTDFSGSITYDPSSTIDSQGFNSSKPNLVSPYLSSSRLELGAPAPAGLFESIGSFPPHGISDNENDGLLTSGSWTVEGRFKFPVAKSFRSPQSLFRIHVTGSSPTHGVILNLVANPNIDEDTDNPDLTLYCRPGFSSTDETLSLKLTGANIFDGNKWYTSIGRKRNDAIESEVSSSYFINLSRQESGEIVEMYTTSSLFLEAPQTALGAIPNALQLKSNPTTSAAINNSGSFLVVGHQSIDTTKNYFLNHSTVPDIARTTAFAGKSGHFRFWSKALSDKEVKEHARSFLSLGVDEPLVNFGFNSEVTGSFERLRLDLSTDQPLTASNSSGYLELVDFSQQSLLNTGSSSNVGYLRGFEQSVQIIKPERFDFSIISPVFDEISDDNKVRLAGMDLAQNVVDFDSSFAPIYELPPDLEPMDDVRFSIEFSVAQALNEDIIKIFATLESLENIIGGPENMFATEYQGLTRLREIYFNRLTGSVNYTAFFEFFRWLDESFDIIIENLIPKKTNYLGFNMIVEPHILERPRVAYGSGDIYLGVNDRRNLKGALYLRQLIANMKRR